MVYASDCIDQAHDTYDHADAGFAFGQVIAGLAPVLHANYLMLESGLDEIVSHIMYGR